MSMKNHSLVKKRVIMQLSSLLRALYRFQSISMKLS